MKAIPLTQGKVALVDDEDFDWLNKWKWCATKDRNTWYAVRAQWKNGKYIRIIMHRLILRAPCGTETDHKDRNGLNNQRDNLRLATTVQNQQNKIKQRGLSSQYKGVSWRKDIAKWRVQIFIKGKRLYLGHFHSEKQAANAYDRAARKHFRKYARLNF